MSIPFFFPPPRYVKTLPVQSGQDFYTLSSLCEELGIPCRASGEWTQRNVIVTVLDSEQDISIYACPGAEGTVQIILPEQYKPVALQVALTVMAYVLHDLVAKQSIAGQPWNRIAPPKGRPRSKRSFTTKERQRAYRLRHSLKPPA